MFKVMRFNPLSLGALLGTFAVLTSFPSATTQVDINTLMAKAEAGGDDAKPDFPPFKDVSKGYTKVSSPDSLYGIWTREKDGQMLAELPAGYANQKQFFAMTSPKGEIFAGLQSGEMYVHWQRFDKRLALIAPQINTISSGDQPSKDSVANHFTDSVVVDIPIVCMGPSGQPVIDMDGLLVGKASTFYGYSANGLRKSLATIAKAKAFPQNIELAFTVPNARGLMKTFHYSISKVPDKGSYKPRLADERVGYFTTVYRDLGQMRDDKTVVRYINRWHLEKAEPNLKLSPPKEPLVYYIEHTVPVRYRRWIKEGVDYWNDAFEKVGLLDAIVVHYQDKSTGAHMDKDPEDVRYNFIRWLSNDIGTAIGPSRAHPETGQLLDADVVLTDGWIRHFWYQANEYVPEMAMEGFSAETLAWLETHPNWDPRIRMATPAKRRELLAERATRRGLTNAGLHTEAGLSTFDTHDGAESISRLSMSMGEGPEALCMASTGKARDMAIMGMTLELMGVLSDDSEGGEDGDEDAEDEADKLDGIPEWFVGPMLADLVAHEVGHTLGLRHNFKASSLYTMAEINSDEIKGKKAFGGSVMDYVPVNVNIESGELQGDYAMIGLGPYDYWAIEFGYGSGDREEVLDKVGEPGNAFATDYETTGTDPLARRYDFSKEPLDYAKNQMRLANWHRERLLTDFVKDGDSWGRARRGYQITLGMQTGALSIMANWIGGAFINNDKKGDPGDRAPIEPVPAAQQRAALDFVIENTFRDEAFGLSPELLTHMSREKWSDPSSWQSAYEDHTFAVHDRIMGIQSSILSSLMTPDNLRRVFDNEYLVPADEDALTLPEMLDSLTNSIWSELSGKANGKYTNRKPMISSLRRNLQREHMQRLVDLSMGAGYGAAYMPISNLATAHLRRLGAQMMRVLSKSDGMLDDYTKAHLEECRLRIEKALEAEFIYNASDIGGGGSTIIFFGEEPQQNR